MDINNLLNQFLGNQSTPASTGQQEDTSATSNHWTDTAKNLAQQATQGGLGGYVGGAITGGLLSLLLTSSKARKIAGGALGYGGAAALGAMALKAYQNYQSNNANNPTPPTNPSTPQTLTQSGGISNNQFGVILIKSMVIACKVDGHIDASEQQRIFQALENSTLAAQEKAIILDALSRPITMQEITGNQYTPEQAAQVYLASRIAIDPDQPAEKEFLTTLATQLKLPNDLVVQLDNQVTQKI